MEKMWKSFRNQVSTILSYLPIISPQLIVIIGLLKQIDRQEFMMNTTSIMQRTAERQGTSVSQSETRDSGSFASIMRIIAKAAGALALFMGILSWEGTVQLQIPFYILSGLILGALIMGTGARAARAGLPILMVVLAITWGVGFFLFGVIIQNDGLLNAQLVFQLLHLAGGLSAIGISERLMRAIERKSA